MSGRTPEQIKHLELLQANIARMYEAAMSMKRFSLVGFVIGASMARYLKEAEIILLTIVVILAFWVLDAKYLQFERSFRDLYDETRCVIGGEEASFKLTPKTGSAIPFRELISWSTSILYVPILTLLTTIWCYWDW